MLRRTLILSLATMLLVTAQAAAERVQITPFAGYRLGGTVDDFEVFDSFDLEDTEALGLTLDFAVTRSLFVELLYSTQETRLEQRAGLFARRELFEIDIDYFHAGIVYRWDLERAKPFIVGSIGITELDPRPPSLDSESRASVGFGGGVQLFFADNFGLRFEGRAFSTFIEERDRFDCGRFCYDYGDGTYLWQFEGRVGLIFAF